MLLNTFSLFLLPYSIKENLFEGSKRLYKQQAQNEVHKHEKIFNDNTLEIIHL